jgi:hypothetical protein
MFEIIINILISWFLLSFIFTFIYGLLNWISSKKENKDE